MPTETFYDGATVDMVTIPGSDGVFGVSANHIPVVAKMQPGVVVVQEEGQAYEQATKYFVSGGFACCHPNSTLDITAVEVALVDDLDPVAVKEGVATFTAELAAATTDEEKANAEIGLEVYSAMAVAVGA